ncbi:hypothetical protein KFK09_023882 [Dendrobium nobile]|uniref:Uncharacterized protein n=1 Tax=Dendrobium nobile TaxID=94219 RepID=A0A8T3ABG5_DENNO|nr:hypothetical protein KFK09_023882 [Dendrobium nobile]
MASHHLGSKHLFNTFGKQYYLIENILSFWLSKLLMSYSYWWDVVLFFLEGSYFLEILSNEPPTHKGVERGM